MLCKTFMQLNDPYDPDNIFARILRGEAPAVRVYEDDMTLAFMDIMPMVPGHVLVIPKTPATNMLSLDAEYAKAMIITAQLLSRAVQQAVQSPGFVVVQLNGAAAGQTVFHVHTHILPRWHGLEPTIHGRELANQEDLEAVAEKIRRALATTLTR